MLQTAMVTGMHECSRYCQLIIAPANVKHVKQMHTFAFYLSFPHYGIIMNI